MAAVQLKLGPTDHGRPVTADELAEVEYESGYYYEVIDGRLYVSPRPNPAEAILDGWLWYRLNALCPQHGGQGPFNFVSNKPRVFVHRRHALTAPEPDMAAYTDWPHQRDIRDLRWEHVSPVLVADVLVDTSPEKELVRNVDLFLEVSTIAEYWVLDGRQGADRPTLIQHRRYGKRWVVRNYPYGDTFTTKLLPGFSLLIDPRK